MKTALFTGVAAIVGFTAVYGMTAASRPPATAYVSQDVVPTGTDDYGRPYRHDAAGNQIATVSWPTLFRTVEDAWACESMEAFDTELGTGSDACFLIEADTEVVISGTYGATFVMTPVDMSEMAGPGEVADFYMIGRNVEAVRVDGLLQRPAGYDGPHYEDGTR